MFKGYTCYNLICTICIYYQFIGYFMKKYALLIVLCQCCIASHLYAQYSVELRTGPAIASTNLDNIYGTALYYGVNVNYRAKDSENEWSIGANQLTFSETSSTIAGDMESNEYYMPILIGLKRYLSDDSKIKPFIMMELGLNYWKSDARVAGLFAEKSGRTLMYTFGGGGAMEIKPKINATLGVYYNSIGTSESFIYYTVLGGLKFTL